MGLRKNERMFVSCIACGKIIKNKEYKKCLKCKETKKEQNNDRRNEEVENNEGYYVNRK